jgi:branched-chain amino acid transport system substrate-binding protein
MLPAGKLLVADELDNSDRQKKLLLQYAKEFETKFERPADTFGGHAWDALSIIAGALKKVGDDRVKLRDEIEKTRGFAGIGGVFKYSPTDHDGLNNDAFVMVKIVNGKWTLAK